MDISGVVTYASRVTLFIHEGISMTEDSPVVEPSINSCHFSASCREDLSVTTLDRGEASANLCDGSREIWE
jgi:hypothetical protein